MLLPILAATLLHSSTINVFAAASLKDAFTTIGKMYETKHPGVEVQFNFAGSQTLAAQINAGAPADVFASAAAKNLEEVQHGPVKVFAQNRLTIIVRKGFTGLSKASDLTSAEKLVLADTSVPAGHYAEEFFAKASRQFGSPWLKEVRDHIVSREQDVRAVLAKVRLGEADAGIVYVSDAASAKGEVVSVPIPTALNVIAKYPVATVNDASNPSGAKEFVQFLLSAAAQKVLKANGFIPAAGS